MFEAGKYVFSETFVLILSKKIGSTFLFASFHVLLMRALMGDPKKVSPMTPSLSFLDPNPNPVLL